MQPTTGYLIDKYIEIRDYIQAKQKELDEHLKVYKDGLVNIENEMLKRLNEQESKSAKSSSGAIAFLQTKTHCRVTDRDKWVDWLANNWEKGVNMLTTHVSKDEVVSYSEEIGRIPAGVEITQVLGVNFRKGG